MLIKLDFRSGQPIYVQIIDQICQMVVSGELKPGDQLPTVRQLATELRVNFNTVARATGCWTKPGSSPPSKVAVPISGRHRQK